MNAGGAESFLMKVFRKLDHEHFMMDFAVSVPDKGIYDDEIISMGGHIYHITPKSRNPIKNFTDIVKIVKTNHYNHVLRTSQHSLSALELIAAWMGGAKYRVFRSSNSGTVSGSRSSILLHRMFTFLPKYIANIRIAPSTEAAEYMFGKGCIKNGKAFIIHNALDLNLYKFRENNRKLVRKEFGISQTTLLVGHIGRFNQQKNHQFLIDVFCCLKELHADSKLLLVGEGELLNVIKDKCEDKGIINDVIFAGIRKDVPYLLSGMDVFVFPSLYEGMPNTVVEAQVNGLPCLISDSITDEAILTTSTSSLPLSCNEAKWANTAIELYHQYSSGNRETAVTEIASQGYMISDVVDEIQKLIYK